MDRITGTIAAALAALLAAPSAAAAPTQPDAAAQAAPAERTTVCALKGKKKPKPFAARTVSITAFLVYNADYGYMLQEPGWPGCEDKIDGTGLLRIELPAGKTLKNFPLLKRASSQDYVRANAGKKIYCTCIGEVSDRGSGPTFTLARVDRLWSDGDKK
jgi:hypothetical protein